MQTFEILGHTTYQCDDGKEWSSVSGLLFESKQVLPKYCCRYLEHLVLTDNGKRKP